MEMVSKKRWEEKSIQIVECRLRSLMLMKDT